MALTNAEKVRRYRERQKELLKTAPDLTLNFMRRPFSEFLEERRSATGFDDSFDYIGIEIKGGLEDEFQHFDTEREFDEPFDGNALDRMTALAGIMMDSSREFFGLINSYKIEELDARIAEIEQADLTDPAVKKKAMTDIVALTHMRAQLGKEFRRTFPEINVKGTPSD